MRSASQLLASLFAILLAISTLAWTQTATTSLRGTVTDPKGAVLQGATVTLNDAATGFSRTTKTGSDGVYQFLQVPPATYTLTVVASGFGTLKRDNVALQVSLPATVDISMEVKGRSEVVEVTGEATLVNTTDATQGNGFGAEQIQSLPAEGRDAVSIVSLQPGVVYVGRSVDQTCDSRGGSVYEYNRSNVGEANDWFNKHNQLNSGFPNEPPHLVRNTFGATAGGPIRKDRVFFFTAYEGKRSRENFQVTRIVPSDNLRNGVVQYLTCGAGAATDCDNPTQVVTLSPQQFASLDPNCTSIGSCPLGPGADPAVMAVFQQYPHPNNDTVGDGLDFRGFTFSSPGPVKLDTHTEKIDCNLTRNGNHHVFVRGNLQNDHFVEKKESVSQTGDSGSEFPGLPPNLTGLSNSKGIIASYNAVLSSNLI